MSDGRESVLTSRQREVLSLLAAGYSSDEIAARLHVTHATVKFHRRGLMQRLDARSAAHAVARAYELGEIGVGRVSFRVRELVSLLAAVVAETPDARRAA